MNTLTELLTHHNVPGTGDSQIDNAREHGIMSVCLDCGSVITVCPALMLSPMEREKVRRKNRDVYDRLGFLDCCNTETVLL